LTSCCARPVEVLGDDRARDLAQLRVLDLRQLQAAGTRRRCAPRLPGGSSAWTRLSAICISSGSTAGVIPEVAAISSSSTRR
jgi:hypothetical protein